MIDPRASDGHRTKLGDWLVGKAFFQIRARKSFGLTHLTVERWRASDNHSHVLGHIATIYATRQQVVVKIGPRFSAAVGKPYGLSERRTLLGVLHLGRYC